MRKKKAWTDTEFNIVSPSQWMATCAKTSALFSDQNIVVIPNGLDTNKFSPKETHRLDNVNLDKKVVCFGSSHQANYKGYDLLYKALQSFRDYLEHSQIVCFGSDLPEKFQDDLPITELGYLEDDSLQMLYSAADAMIVPSRTESFGQIISESLASGTPVVAFNATGPKDIIDHKETGYLASPYDPDDLSRGIKWVITNSKRNTRLGQRAREAAKQRFAIERVANQHYELYQTILTQS